MKKATLFGLCAAAMLAGLSGPVSAAEYSFSLDGSGYTASGTITTNSTSSTNPFPCPTCATGPGYDITNITGTINGQAITGAVAVNGFDGNDNLAFLTAPYVDYNGVAFTTATDTYNVFAGLTYGHPGNYIVDSKQFAPLYGLPVTLTASTPAVPEPSTWAMMLAGFAMAGLALRWRQRVAVPV